MAENNIIYMDNAATTRISDEVLEAMMPYLKENYGNASSFYDLGRKSRDAIEEARAKVAHLINAEPEEIFFTSGGSESNNWAVGEFNTLTSAIEHPSILNADIGRAVRVDEYGFVDTNEIRYEVDNVDWSLVSVMTANNEVGTLQPISEIAEICMEYDVYFHTDAVQALGHIPIDVKAMNIDMLSASGHKIHAPKGIGFLYISKNVSAMESFISGGHQERGMRAGTENVAGIVGFGEAAYQAEIALHDGVNGVGKIRDIRDHMIERMLSEIPGCTLNGDRYRRLPNNINVSFDGVSGEALAMCLASRGICVSSGSACATGSHEPSHVLKAMGRTAEEAHRALRITLSKYNTMSEANAVVGATKEEVERLRSYIGRTR